MIKNIVIKSNMAQRVSPKPCSDWVLLWTGLYFFFFYQNDNIFCIYIYKHTWKDVVFEFLFLKNKVHVNSLICDWDLDQVNSLAVCYNYD
jgi:hypothetical protein